MLLRASFAKYYYESGPAPQFPGPIHESVEHLPLDPIVGCKNLPQLYIAMRLLTAILVRKQFALFTNPGSRSIGS